MEAKREDDGSYTVNGTYYVFQEMKKDGMLTASKLDEVKSSSFSLYPSGEMIIERDEVYPLLRSFPTYGDEPLKKGDSWRSFLEKVILKDDTVTVIPLYCEYFYNGTGFYKGVEVHKISAKYAVRYNRGDDPDGDENLKNISGTHDVSIMIEVETGYPVLFRDSLKELHTYTDGGTIEKTGFILTFFKGIQSMDRKSVKEDIRNRLNRDSLDNVEIKDTEHGLSLVLNHLHFVPDQAVILPEDRNLLDTIAESLKGIEGRTFFVRGHTADIGSMESQVELSEKRAFVVIQELVKRGLREDRFIYSGIGGAEPVAPNNTDEGKARNRRVEIVILED
ncbi:MAG: OmpA family protein [bacterium]|nr:OmpA family protein [bacterium]